MADSSSSSKDTPENEEGDTKLQKRFSSAGTQTNKIHGDVAIPYSELTIGVLKERTDGETRVSQTPDSVANLVKAGFTVLVESGGTSNVSCQYVLSIYCLCLFGLW